jgi:hypothetical protein
VSAGVAYGRSTTFCEESWRGAGPRRDSLSILPWGGALALGVVLALIAPPAPTSAIVTARPAVAAAPEPSRALANPYGDLVAFNRSPVDHYGALVDGFPHPASAAPSAAPSLQAKIDIVPSAPAATPQAQDPPSPPRRDAAAIAAGAPPPLRAAGVASLAAPATSSPDGVVAYAAPDDQAATGAHSPALAAVDRASGSSSFARSAPSPVTDNLTAIYDISAHTVTLPNGTKLEAHSGLGSRLDNPRFVAEHDRGATPPHLYELGLVDGLFHGVQALRLNPVGGDGAVFGRTGLLAHTYMLGPNGDSNGCVAFKNYDAFLRAYQQGHVKRLIVVARLD